ASVIVMYESQGPKTTISMTIGSPAMTVNGTTLALDINPLVVPVIRLGRTLVPVRSIVQALGGQVVWDAKTQHVTLTLAAHKVVLTINQSVAVVDGKSARIDTADAKVVPTILNGTTMAPFRFVIEALGGSVQWDGTLRTITVFYLKP
ncbi:MAG: copper amine oxidase N-terminal domain-containing protein, partial [Caldiserica bacterium]|nr:copper amine oxidase N-terminal domain-containing protein [Caldisericota bacterium]